MSILIFQQFQFLYTSYNYFMFYLISAINFFCLILSGWTWLSTRRYKVPLYENCFYRIATCFTQNVAELTGHIKTVIYSRFKIIILSEKLKHGWTSHHSTQKHILFILKLNSYWKYKSHIINKIVIYVIYTHTHSHTLLWHLNRFICSEMLLTAEQNNVIFLEFGELKWTCFLTLNQPWWLYQVQTHLTRRQ